jgi:hypothetical protein
MELATKNTAQSDLKVCVGAPDISDGHHSENIPEILCVSLAPKNTIASTTKRTTKRSGREKGKITSEMRNDTARHPTIITMDFPMPKNEQLQDEINFAVMESRQHGTTQNWQNKMGYVPSAESTCLPENSRSTWPSIIATSPERHAGFYAIPAIPESDGLRKNCGLKAHWITSSRIDNANTFGWTGAGDFLPSAPFLF